MRFSRKDAKAQRFQSNRIIKKASFLNLIVFFFFSSFQISSAKLSDWQQRVNYDIDVTLLDSIHTWQGTARITYINNSPDTLATLWFRLPAEARKAGSIEDRTLYRGGRNRLKNLPVKDWGGLSIESSWADDRKVSFSPDGSIGSLHLEPPVLPGDSAVFTLEFRSKFPSGRGSFRIAYIDGQYKGAYWYPMICPYTPEYGWTVNRYFGTAEAYGEFGDFNLRYTVPYRFIVASTGELVNENEVLPPERILGLAKDNPDPIPIPDGEEGDRPVTWIYRAENVPDVAFAADPGFLIDRIDFGHFEAWAFIRRGRQEQWDDAAYVCGWTIQQLEEIYGAYPWTRVYATDSYSAMEYPMLTMMSWETPLYRFVMMHEVIHNYTPMILHSNSVDAPVLDEGFTTFIEHELINRFDKTPYNRKRTHTRGLFSKEFIERDDEVRGKRPYLESVLDGKDLPMVRGADVAEDYWQLRVSTYYKTPVMLNALRSVIGEEAFWRGFRIYYRDNALTHVDENDMIEAFEEASGRGLGWFFKQFLYDSGDIDYVLTEFEVIDTDSNYQVNVGIRRGGEVRLPVRIGIITEAGDTLRGEISFLPTDKTLARYERWGWWDQLHDPSRSYEFSINLKEEQIPERILLDPDKKYTDRNPHDNSIPAPSPEFKYDLLFNPFPPPSLDRSRLQIGPTAGYEQRQHAFFGLKFRESYIGRERKTAIDIFFPDYEEKGLPQFRASFIRKLVMGRLTPELKIKTGILHRDLWLLSDLNRTWHNQDEKIRNVNASLVVGIWERWNDEFVYPLRIAQDSGAVFVSFIRLKLDIETKDKVPTRQTFIYTKGKHILGFSLLEWKSDYSYSLPGGWKSGLETRFMNSSDYTPVIFLPKLGSDSEYELLGEPLFGYRWTNKTDLPSFPVPETKAAVTHIPNDYYVKRFMSYRLRISRSLPTLLKRTGTDPVDRLLGKFHFGLFQAGGTLFSYYPRYFLEAGPEIILNDLYGVSFSMRCAPWTRWNYGKNNNMDQTPWGWSWNDWWSNAVIYVSIKSDGFFR